MDGRMVFLGFGKWARADKIYALQPITGDNRGGGQRTLVWVEGVPDPIIASRTERTILHDMGQDASRLAAPRRGALARRAAGGRRLHRPGRPGRSRPPGPQAARVVEQAA